jgi:hypothetical protein
MIGGVTDLNRVWRSPELAYTVEKIEAELDEAWAGLLGGQNIAVGSAEETALAWLVVDNPAEHDWRVVDAAIVRLPCTECGAGLTQGSPTCHLCTYYHGVRFAAREVDRPDVPPGNEHALRVAYAVARTRTRYPPRARVGHELALPDLVAGKLPTTEQAQAGKALINKLTPDECDTVVSLAEVEELTRAR